MSLNWREIDCILDEIPLAGSIIRQIHQPSHATLTLEFYSPRNSFTLFFSFTNPYCRLHMLTRKLPNPKKPPRFVSFLRAHIRHGRVMKAYQIVRERIVKIEIVKKENQVTLWVRLWGGAANMIATDRESNILDAFYRRPRRKEITGGFYNPEEIFKSNTSEQHDKEQYLIRELPGPGSFNERIDRFYFELEQEKDRKTLLSKLDQQFLGRENRILVNLEKLQQRLNRYRGFDQFKLYGDLILSNLHKIRKRDKWLETEDFENSDSVIDIELDPELSPAENAEHYFEQYRKAKTGFRKIKEEVELQKKNLAAVQKRRTRILREKDLEKVRAELKGSEKQSRKTDKDLPPGLIFYSSDFQILVGRSAKENDGLLRRSVKGNDFWFHSRDYPGSYVFIKSRSGKSVPLEVMLDAGNLALFYSKGKSTGKGDVYYTQVKFLRRAKHGKTGLVIPTQEKNLFIKIDRKRLARLKESSDLPL